MEQSDINEPKFEEDSLNQIPTIEIQKKKDPILQTKQLSHDQKLVRFKEWCDNNGVIAPKVKFPATFGNGLTGMMCTEEIEYREAYIYIPYKILITLDQAYRNPTLKEIIDKYPIF